MSFTYRFIAVLFTMVAVIHLSAPPSFSTEAEVKALQEKINKLETKINLIEHDFDQRLRAIERRTRPVQKKNDGIEENAEGELNSIVKLISNEQIPLAREKLTEFFKTYGSTRSAVNARKLMDEISVIGMNIPTNWQIKKWFQGKDEIELKKQSTLLVLFWETWCSHCRQEAPKIEKLYKKYKNKGLQVIGLTKVSGSSSPEKVIEFIKINSITYPIAQEDDALAQYFKVEGVPAAALISNGKIVWRGNPERLPGRLLKKYLGIPIHPNRSLDKTKPSPAT